MGKAMNEISVVQRTLFVCSIFLLLALRPLSAAGFESPPVDLSFTGETMSADLKGVSLGVVLKRINQEKGIWFKADTSLLEEKVAVRFSGLTLEKGLKRILASENYSFVYDGNKKLVGIIIIDGRGDRSTDKKSEKVGSLEHNTPTTERADQAEFMDEPGEVVSTPSPGGTPAERLDKDSEIFGAAEDIAPPEGNVKTSEDDVEDFKVIKNTPPPGD